MKNKKLLIFSNSQGLRTSEITSVWNRILPEYLRHSHCGPWALRTYTLETLSITKSAYSICHFLSLIENQEIRVNDFNYAVFCIGVPEGWIWSEEYGYKGYKEKTINKIVDMFPNSKWASLLKSDFNMWGDENAPLSIMTEQVWRIYLQELKKSILDLEQVVFLIIDNNLYKEYAKDNMKIFNDIILEEFSNIANVKFEIMSSSDGVELYDNVHLTEKANNIVADRLMSNFNIKYGTFKNRVQNYQKFYKINNSSYGVFLTYIVRNIYKIIANKISIIKRKML